MRRFIRGSSDGSVISWDEPLCEEHKVLERPAFAADRGAGDYEVPLPCGDTARLTVTFEGMPEPPPAAEPVPNPAGLTEDDVALLAEFRAWKATQGL